jgi:hypothetical protein
LKIHLATVPCASDQPSLDQSASRHRDRNAPVVREREAIEEVNDLLNGYVAAFDPGNQEFTKLRGDQYTPIGEQLGHEIAKQVIIRLINVHVRRGGEP